MSETIEAGTVWLVGAGPGDPDLLTRKAERLIGAADIIFHDALVGPAILEMAPAGTALVSVGKRSGRHSQHQDSINDLLLAAARAGQRVVRLKGGDPAIFGRAAEEIAHLRGHGIAVHICPGITAASAAAAAAGLSLTLRGLARKLTFITAHVRAGAVLDLDWQVLADPQATLAIYMGKAACGTIATRLIAAGMAGDTPAMVVENASLPGQRIVRTRLDLLAIATAARLNDGPAMLLIGAAVAMPQVESCLAAPAVVLHP